MYEMAELKRQSQITIQWYVGKLVSHDHRTKASPFPSVDVCRAWPQIPESENLLQWMLDNLKTQIHMPAYEHQNISDLRAIIPLFLLSGDVKALKDEKHTT